MSPLSTMAPTATDFASTGSANADASRLAWRPLSPHAGALVDGVDLAEPLGRPAVAALADLLAERAMVVFRGQRLDDAAHLALAEQLGTPAVSPLRALLGSANCLATIEDTATRPPAGFDWHTDESWTAAPPQYGLLQALEIPPAGGDTIWANTAVAYDRLAPALRRLAAELTVVHSPGDDYLATVAAHHGAATAAALAAAHPPIEQPLVRRHPRSGRPCLWLSPLYQRHVVGVDPATSTALLTLFTRALDDPEIQVRWRWDVGDVVIWDETSTCHRALTDHFPARRRMRRCTTVGSAPVGIASDAGVGIAAW